METVVILYLISVLPNIAKLCAVLGVVGVFFGCVCFTIGVFTKPSEKEIELVAGGDGCMNTKERVRSYPLFQKFRKILLVPSIVSLLFGMMIPSEKSMWIIAGGYIAQEALVSDVGQDVAEIIKAKLKEYKDELIEKGE